MAQNAGEKTVLMLLTDAGENARETLPREKQ
jgi:hypothetical protein